MKKSLSFWQIFGFIFTGVAGVVLHFLFDWTNQNIVVAPFCAVNESTWEHMKILFIPMFVFAIIENLYIGKRYKSFWCVKLIGIVFGILLIPVLFYTINGIFGPTPDFVNIATFYVAAAVSYLGEAWLMKKDVVNCKYPEKAIAILVIIAVLFAIFTFVTPQIPLFEDPITNTYGYFQIV
ncbi:MAG: hypothetical protein IJ423_01740 [Clostridia bacterium]|nr:hypothetical protein [Clostridia bacterium]